MPMATLRVMPIPCLEDNYAYLLDDGSGELAIVDASEAEPVEAKLAQAKGLRFSAYSTASSGTLKWLRAVFPIYPRSLMPMGLV